MRIKYYIKERFWFQLGAFNQSNRIQYSFYINIHVISYMAVVKYVFNDHLKKRKEERVQIIFCP